MEDFEMSPPEAVEDAMKQFKVQGVNLDNLDLSVPTDENRAERSKFIAATELLDGVVDSDSGDVNLKTCAQPVAALKDALMTVNDFCGPDHANAKIYRSLLVTNAAIYTLMSFLGVEGDGKVELLEVSEGRQRCIICWLSWRLFLPNTFRDLLRSSRRSS